MIADHLLEAFVPEDDLRSGGLVHEEARPGLTCFCGLIAATPGELDAHFLQVLTPGDLIGWDSQQQDGSFEKILDSYLSHAVSR